MNTTEDIITTECPAVAPQPINKVIKPIKFPAQPQEWKIVSLRECPTPENIQQCETPEQAAACWKTHIANHPYFNSECECLVVFILNTRRRIKVTIWCPLARWNTILCHPREIFRLAVRASAAAIRIDVGERTGAQALSEHQEILHGSDRLGVRTQQMFGCRQGARDSILTHAAALFEDAVVYPPLDFKKDRRVRLIVVKAHAQFVAVLFAVDRRPERVERVRVQIQAMDRIAEAWLTDAVLVQFQMAEKEGTPGSRWPGFQRACISARSAVVARGQCAYMVKQDCLLLAVSL